MNIKTIDTNNYIYTYTIITNYVRYNYMSKYT